MELNNLNQIALMSNVMLEFYASAPGLEGWEARITPTVGGLQGCRVAGVQGAGVQGVQGCRGAGGERMHAQ